MPPYLRPFLNIPNNLIKIIFLHIYFLSLTKGTIDNIRLRFYFKGHAMPISAKNQLEVEITEGKNRCGKFSNRS